MRPSPPPDSATDPTASPPSGIRFWWAQLWGVVRKLLIFSFAGFGIILLVRFGGKAAIIIIPVLILLFGTGLYAWMRIKMRKKK